MARKISSTKWFKSVNGQVINLTTSISSASQASGNIKILPGNKFRFALFSSRGDNNTSIFCAVPETIMVTGIKIRTKSTKAGGGYIIRTNGAQIASINVATGSIWKEGPLVVPTVVTAGSKLTVVNITTSQSGVVVISYDPVDTDYEVTSLDP